MIRRTRQLREFERWYASTHVASRSYQDSLSVFAGLWRHARHVNPYFVADWQHDVQADIELARVLNGLPNRG
jgi:hypothetical protein